MQSEMNNCVLPNEVVAIAQGHSNLMTAHVNGLKVVFVPIPVGFPNQLTAVNQNHEYAAKL